MAKEEWANELGVDKNTLIRTENGKINPELKKEKIAYNICVVMVNEVML